MWDTIGSSEGSQEGIRDGSLSGKIKGREYKIHKGNTVVGGLRIVFA